MWVEIPELENVPVDQRQELLHAAARSVQTTHGRMGAAPHYIGFTLTVIVVGALTLINRGLLVSVLVGAPLYLGCVLIGFLLWRRSIILETKRVIRQLIGQRELPTSSGEVKPPPEEPSAR